MSDVRFSSPCCSALFSGVSIICSVFVVMFMSSVSCCKVVELGGVSNIGWVCGISSVVSVSMCNSMISGSSSCVGSCCSSGSSYSSIVSGGVSGIGCSSSICLFVVAERVIGR